MIAYLEGKILKKYSDKIIVFIAGIGYEVFISFQTFCNLKEIGEDIKLNIYHHVKEDRSELYGFNSEYEKEVFVKLISIGGIGPKTALGIMSPHPVNQLEEAIEEENINFLVKIPGIGKKTAQRIVLELKDKLKKIETESKLPKPEISESNLVKEDAILALINLGYKKPNVEKIINKIFAENSNPDFETVLKLAFEKLS